MLVHDMRSPMQVLLAHLELLRNDIRGESVRDVEAALGGATDPASHDHQPSLTSADSRRGGCQSQRSVTDLSALAHVCRDGRPHPPADS